MIITIRRHASTGSATRNTNASLALIENTIDVAAISITGLLPKGLMPLDMAFCIFVISLVSLVTSDEVLKWSIFINEYDCNLLYWASLRLAPSP